METNYPEPGFYKKYDWSAKDPMGVGIIEVLGVTYDTDNKGTPPKVLYRPLDPNMLVYKEGRATEFKLLESFLETREHAGKTVPRFEKITDQIHIAGLVNTRDEMYPDRISW